MSDPWPRIVRLPGHRFRGELTDEIRPAHDASGKIDIAGTMQIITSVVEGWIREYPEQWLWLHRRWRPEDRKQPWPLGGGSRFGRKARRFPGYNAAGQVRLVRKATILGGERGRH